MKVSLDPYRTKGVTVFSGIDRGKVVAEEIKKQYGEDVEIIIPDDVICISHSFINGIESVLPEKTDWGVFDRRRNQ